MVSVPNASNAQCVVEASRSEQYLVVGGVVGEEGEVVMELLLGPAPQNKSSHSQKLVTARRY